MCLTALRSPALAQSRALFQLSLIWQLLYARPPSRSWSKNCPCSSFFWYPLLFCTKLRITADEACKLSDHAFADEQLSVVLAATVETLCPLLVINSFVNFDIVFNLFLINWLTRVCVCVCVTLSVRFLCCHLRATSWHWTEADQKKKNAGGQGRVDFIPHSSSDI